MMLLTANMFAYMVCTFNASHKQSEHANQTLLAHYKEILVFSLVVVLKSNFLQQMFLFRGLLKQTVSYM